MTPALATALAWLASVFAAVVVFALGCAVVVLVTRLVDDGGPLHATLDEIKNGEQRAGPPPDSLTVEPDPIESYPFGILPPITLRVAVWVHHPGEMPVPLNPLGQSEAETRVRS